MSKADEQQVLEQETTAEEEVKNTNDGILSNGNVRWMSPAYIKHTKYKVSSAVEKLGSEFESLTSVNQMPNFIEKCFHVIDDGNLSADDEEVLSDLEPNLFIYKTSDERKKWLDSYKEWVGKRSNLIQRFANAAVSSSGRKFVEGIDLNDLQIEIDKLKSWCN